MGDLHQTFIIAGLPVHFAAVAWVLAATQVVRPCTHLFKARLMSHACVRPHVSYHPSAAANIFDSCHCCRCSPGSLHTILPTHTHSAGLFRCTWQLHGFRAAVAPSSASRLRRLADVLSWRLGRPHKMNPSYDSYKGTPPMPPRLHQPTDATALAVDVLPGASSTPPSHNSVGLCPLTWQLHGFRAAAAPSSVNRLRRQAGLQGWRRRRLLFRPGRLSWMGSVGSSPKIGACWSNWRGSWRWVGRLKGSTAQL